MNIEILKKLQDIRFIDSYKSNTRNNEFTIVKNGNQIVYCVNGTGEKCTLQVLKNNKELNIYKNMNDEKVVPYVLRNLSNVSRTVNFDKYFDTYKYPTRFTGSCIVPVRLTSAGLVLSDGKRSYLYKGDGKTGLVLFQCLYDKGREWELLLLPEVSTYALHSAAEKRPCGMLPDNHILDAIFALYDIGNERYSKITSNTTYKFKEVVSTEDSWYGATDNTKKVLYSSIAKQYKISQNYSFVDTIRICSDKKKVMNLKSAHIIKSGPGSGIRMTIEGMEIKKQSDSRMEVWADNVLFKSYDYSVPANNFRKGPFKVGEFDYSLAEGRRIQDVMIGDSVDGPSEFWVGGGYSHSEEFAGREIETSVIWVSGEDYDSQDIVVITSDDEGLQLAWDLFWDPEYDVYEEDTEVEE